VKTRTAVWTVAAIVAFAASSSAAGLADQFAACAQKFANTKTSASVMLECNAAGGKLTDCKVLESSANGFDKAAMCVAEVLPIGSRTGAIKVPVKFEPQG
jgi:hypothetical protein